MRALLICLLACLSFPALGEERWTRVHLGDYLSEPGESLEPFVRRLARVLFEHTRRTGTEACGVIGQDGSGRFGVSLYSDGVQRGCTMLKSETPMGFKFLGKTIHSHPPVREIRLTPQDIAWNRAHGQMISGGTMLIKEGFSRSDLQTGAGWLVQEFSLYYYNGTSLRGQRKGIIGTEKDMPRPETAK